VIRLASKYGRYGYKRITALLRQDGWHVNHKRVARIWREEGLKVPSRQPKRSRLWLNDGSCVRLRPEYPNHVWSYDFVAERTHDNRSFRILTLIDEYSKESLALEPKRRFTSMDVIEVLSDLFVTRGLPQYIRSEMVRSSHPRPFRNGSLIYRWGLCLSSQVALGRTGITSPSMGSSGMNYSTEKYSTHCRRLKSCWRGGGCTIIPKGRIPAWDTGLRYRRP